MHLFGALFIAAAIARRNKKPGYQQYSPAPDFNIAASQFQSACGAAAVLASIPGALV